MSVHAVQCRSCGGAVAQEAGSVLPRCLFCGRDALERAELDEVAPPEGYLDFATDEAAARAAFRGWAKRRFWAPRSIRTAKVELSRLFLPAWVWSGHLETHWAALVRAGTRSGKRPVTGREEGTIEGVLVPSSPAITPGELAALAPFSISGLQPLTDAGPPGPWEVGRLTRDVARERGVAGMSEAHGAQIGARISAARIKTSSVAHSAQGTPLLLPIWIGAYLHDDTSYRVVVNGQSGAVTGKAPISWAKIVAAVLAVLGVAFVFAVVAALNQ